ncbi:glycosyltransferase family 2 protein [Arthrobacter oryzae]|uniref:glycosyltransferase family 2 protein n=1 Tax=Arthrobacter oryzae TaxID=409290 RepID=UPI00277D7DE5|nr:glycosyltransferase involved in cell wall biosynthesis [Arthrobacter oryzae]
MISQEVSIVIPAFNSASHIRESIESAKGIAAKEIIVIDDGSTDNTAAIAQNLGCTVISQENCGTARARRVGVGVVSTPLTIMLDADDALVPAGVAESLRLAAEHEDSAVIAGSTLFVGGATSRKTRAWPEGISVATLLERGIAPGPPGAFLWKTSALRLALDDPLPALSPRYAEDYELLIRGARVGKVLSHNEVACAYASEGGKSALAPLRCNTAAEEIRRYYAKVSGAPIRERSNGELQSMAYLRMAYSSRGEPLKHLTLLMKAALRTPLLVPRLLGRKLRRAFFPQSSEL